MREILLTQGKVAFVDDTDYEELSKHKWCAHKHSSGNFYAMRMPTQINGKRHTIYMAREILGLKHGDKRQADHIDHNTLNNCQVNLRVCTNQQNQMNQKSHLNKTSQFKGVSWNKQHNKWYAQIMINGITKSLGFWNTEEVAALAYDMVAIREFGDFAHLNFN